MKFERVKKSYDFLWLSLALLFALIISYLLALMPADYWWNLRVGQETLQLGHVPAVNTYSTVRAGEPVIYSDWLAAVILWLVYRLGGVTLTVLLRGVFTAVTFSLLWMGIRRASGPKLATIITIFVLLASSRNWPPVRPQLFAFPLFLLTYLIIQDWRKGNTRKVWWLPLVAAVWANLHGSFILLYILAVSALILGKGNRKQLAIATLLAILAGNLNPFGVRIWGTLLEAGNIRTVSLEWAPPSMDGWTMYLFYGWLLLFPLLAALSPRKLALLDWVWFIGIGWMALSGTRFVIWFQFIMAFQTVEFLADWDKQHLDRTAPAPFPGINFTIGSLMLLAPLALLPGVRQGWWKASPQDLTESTPVQAVEWLKAHPNLPGPLWNDFVFSSYLIYALPSRPVFIDVRMHQAGFTDQQYEDYFLVHDAETGWHNFLNNQGINLLVLDVEEESTLVDALSTRADWKLQYQDKVSAIYSRVNP